MPTKDPVAKPAASCPRVAPYVQPTDGEAARNGLRFYVQDISYTRVFGVELRWSRGWRGKDLRVSIGKRRLVFFVGHQPECGCEECIPF